VDAFIRCWKTTIRLGECILPQMHSVHVDGVGRGRGMSRRQLFPAMLMVQQWCISGADVRPPSAIR
jgi:hypothetical protein